MDNQLSITDLAVLKSIIEVASTRGAFQAGEMRQVGEIYDKLTSFLKTVVAQADAEAQSKQQGEAK